MHVYICYGFLANYQKMLQAVSVTPLKVMSDNMMKM